MVDTVPTMVRVRYWAAAKAAAGCASETLAVEGRQPGGVSVGDVLSAAVARHPDLQQVVAVASVLLDGSVVGRDRSVDGDATLEVLPPFAGG